MYYKEIVNIIYDENFKQLTNSEKVEYLLEKIKEFELNLSLKENIEFNNNVSIINIINGLNSVTSYEKRRKHNKKLINSILFVMSSIQNKNINFITLNNANFKTPVCTYEDNLLVCIKSYNRQDYLMVLNKLLDYLEQDFYLNCNFYLKKYEK